jgi:hypothetical protein
MYEREEKFAVGLSYDVNVSSLVNTSKGRGGLELMMRYTPPAKTHLYKDNPMF